MLLNVFPRFSVPNKLGDFTPISESMFLKTFKEKKLFFSSPIRVKDWEVKSIDDMIFFRNLI